MLFARAHRLQKLREEQDTELAVAIVNAFGEALKKGQRSSGRRRN